MDAAEGTARRDHRRSNTTHVAILDLIAVLGLVVQNPLAVEPQGTPSTTAAPRDPSLDRIRSGLSQRPVITVPDANSPSSSERASDRPLFQVHVEASLVPAWDWLETHSVPTYVRPTYTLTHHEFMLSVTPEVFRGVSTHPYGVPAGSITRAIVKATKGPLKRRKEAKARQEVAEAVKALEESAGNAKAKKEP
jgi:hypothetical protein